MRTNIFCGVSFALIIAALGCGGGDGGDSDAVASNSSTPPSPPSAPSAPTPGDSSASGAPAPGSSDPGSSGYPGGSGPPGSSSTGYPGGSGPPGYPGSSGPPGSSSTGYPGGSGPPGYPGGSAPPGSPPTGYPGGSTPPGAFSGYPGAAGDGVATPPRPKSLRQKAVDAFREGRSDEGAQLLAAHYLTNPSAGSELSRVMQWGGPVLRKPVLLTRVGLAVVYVSQPPTYDGSPQPIGSPELEASMASMERATGGKGEGGNREGGNPRVRRPGGPGGEANPGVIGPPGGSGFEGAPGYGGGGQNQATQSPEEELKYFTGDLGTQLIAQIKAKLEAGEFGTIYREVLKNMPVAEKGAGQAGAEFGPGISGPGPGGTGIPGGPGGRSGPPSGYPGRGPDGAEGGEGGEGGPAAKSSGGVTGQVIPGVEFLGAVATVKELGELIKSSSVDAVIYFEVRVRPATATKFVNNDTTMRLVAAAEPTKQLFASAKLNNKQVHEARKKRGAEDPVAKEIDATVAALEASFKLVPLPNLTAEQVHTRINYLLGLKPEDATALLLETRLFVTKKLLKPEDAVTLALTAVSDDQLGSLSEVIGEGDVKELIGSALTGKRADAPTTVLGKFGAALGGAGGIGNLVPTPQIPPLGMPPGSPNGYGPGGFPPQPGTSTEEGSSSGAVPQASGDPSGNP